MLKARLNFQKIQIYIVCVRRRKYDDDRVENFIAMIVEINGKFFVSLCTSNICLVRLFSESHNGKISESI